MYSPDEHRILYDSLSRKRKMMVLAEVKKWADWSKTTFYRKLACPNLPLIERVMLDGIIKEYANRPDAGQLELQFDWSETEFKMAHRTRSVCAKGRAQST